MKEADVPGIAQLLVKLGVLLPGELAASPGLHASLLDPQASLTLAAGVRQRLGELLTNAKRLFDEQIAHALTEQAKSGGKLGEVLIRLGYLTLGERDVVVEFQRRQGSEATASDKLRLGELLVSTGQISELQLAEAIERKRTTGRRIGEELVAAGQLSEVRLESALALQRRLVIAALIVALSPFTPGSAKRAHAADVRATMGVTAFVVDAVAINALHQTDTLTITDLDIKRGYVEVASGSRFDIRNNRPCLFEFRGLGNIFRSVAITGLDGTKELSPAGGTIMKTLGTGLARVVVGYRFNLEPGLRAGAYNWPLALTVLPMS